jgi:hypothetical protein
MLTTHYRRRILRRSPSQRHRPRHIYIYRIIPLARPFWHLASLTRCLLLGLKEGRNIMSDQRHWRSNKLTWRNERWVNRKPCGVLIRIADSERRSPLLTIILMLITISTSTLAVFATPTRPLSHTLSLAHRASNDSSLLECLQVTPPILSPVGSCQQTLMAHTFAASYGQPFVGK